MLAYWEWVQTKKHVRQVVDGRMEGEKNVTVKIYYIFVVVVVDDAAAVERF